MNDDWDGVDWAMSFAGPDDDEIEIQRQQEFQESLRDECIGYGSSEIRGQRKSDAVWFVSFETATNYAKTMAENLQLSFDLEEIGSHWRVVSSDASLSGSVPEVEEVSDFDPMADEQDADDSKFFLGIALFKALQDKDRDLALQLIERPIEINVLGQRGTSPLMVAAYRGYFEICEKLLQLGATFETEISMDPGLEQEDDGSCEDTVMHRAFLSRDWQTIEIIGKAYIAAEWKFLRTIETIDSSDFQYFGYPRLVEASRYGMTALCAEMIECGIDVNKGYSSDTSDKPIEAAYGNDKMTTCFALVAMGADISPLREMDGFTTEFEAALTIVRQYFEKNQPANCSAWSCAMSSTCRIT